MSSNSSVRTPPGRPRCSAAILLSVAQIKEMDDRQGGAKDPLTEREDYARDPSSGSVSEKAAVLVDRAFEAAIAVVNWHAELEYREVRVPAVSPCKRMSFWRSSMSDFLDIGSPAPSLVMLLLFVFKRFFPR